MDKNIVAGFSGNVIGGFAILDTLSKTIKQNRKSEDQVCEPEVFIDLWSSIAKNHFKKLKGRYKKGGVSILIGGISFSKDIGLAGRGKPTLAILRSPDFDPDYIEIGKWGSIGSGTASRQYMKLLDKNLGNTFHPAMKMETAFSGGFAQALAISISYGAQRGVPVRGVSKHFHIVTLSREGVTGGSSDHKEYPLTGEVIEIKMPKVAKSLNEFLRLIEGTEEESMIATTRSKMC